MRNQIKCNIELTSLNDNLAAKLLDAAAVASIVESVKRDCRRNA